MDTSTTLDEFEGAGITALVRAGEAKNWFMGHLGATMIAGARLLRDPNLPGPAALALSAKLQALLVAQRDWFVPLEGLGATVVGVDPILSVLRDSAGILRTAGHATIYMSAALHALSKQPPMATDRVVEGLLHLHEAARDDDPARHYGSSNYFESVDRESKDARDEGSGSIDILGESFAGLDHLVVDQKIDGRFYFLAGEKIHLITHAHAIATFEELGYHDIAAFAVSAQRSLLRLVASSDVLEASVFEPTDRTPFEAKFWEQDVPDPFHVIKLAEAVVAQVPRLPELEQASAGDRLRRMWSILGIR